MTLQTQGCQGRRDPPGACRSTPRAWGRTSDREQQGRTLFRPRSPVSVVLVRVEVFAWKGARPRVCAPRPGPDVAGKIMLAGATNEDNRFDKLPGGGSHRRAASTRFSLVAPA